MHYVDDMDHVTVTIEGNLDRAIVESLAEDLRAKLALVENVECWIKWIE